MISKNQKASFNEEFFLNNPRVVLDAVYSGQVAIVNENGYQIATLSKERVLTQEQAAEMLKGVAVSYGADMDCTACLTVLGKAMRGQPDYLCLGHMGANHAELVQLRKEAKSWRDLLEAFGDRSDFIYEEDWRDHGIEVVKYIEKVKKSG